MDFKRSLKEQAQQLDIHLDETQLRQFVRFYEMLIEKNKVMNLTSIVEPIDVIEKHFIDSLSCISVYDFHFVSSVLDLGTGAGFPGIPLKILFPHISFVLVDSVRKKTLFLEDVIKELGLTNISVVCGRAEELARLPEYREKFDLCVSRAVANLSTLSEYCIPFLKSKGVFIAYKSEKGLSEIEDARKCLSLLGAEIDKSVSFTLSNQHLFRVLVVIKKCRTTPKNYPRRVGIPSKDPL